MPPLPLRLARFFRARGPVHALALSGDGTYVLAGSEEDLCLLDHRGAAHYRWSDSVVASNGSADGQGPPGWPFSAVALAPDLSIGLALERRGRLHKLHFQPHDDEVEVRAEPLWAAEGDLYSLANARGSDLVVLGHYGVPVTGLDLWGRVRWRCDPALGTGLGGRSWSVAVNPAAKLVYAGCSGRDRRSGERPFLIVALDSARGHPRGAVATAERVTHIVALDDSMGAVAVLTASGAGGPRQQRLVAYSTLLAGMIWSRAWDRGDTVTSLACDASSESIVVGTTYGLLWVLDARTGEVSDRHDLLYHSTVLSIGTSAYGDIAAGLANGMVAYLECQPVADREMQ